MSKKAKSKQPARRKYVTAGALGYNQANYTGSDFASPYATNPFYYDAGAAMASQQQMKSAMSASDVLRQKALEQNKTREAEDKARREDLKAAKEESKAAGQQQLKGVGMEAGTLLAEEGIGKILGREGGKQISKKLTKQAAANFSSSVGGQMGVESAQQVATAAGPGNVAAQAALVQANIAAAAPKANFLTANMSGLASAGIGLGLTGAGLLIENKTSDNDYTTFTEKERKGNLWGSAIKGAGSGVGYGTAAGSVLPGIGNVAGAVIGGLAGAGVGLVKGIKENKQAKKAAQDYQKEQADLAAERAKEQAIIEAENAKIAGAYNAAFVKSRLTGAQSGYGYGTSNNPSMMTTPNFYGKTGGVKVPGGQVVPIEGSDAVEFVGRKHSQGGILLDPQTEVEGGETMDQVMMAKTGGKGKMNDYFFSAYLKLGGKSFAQRHKEILKSGGKQADIQKLAEMQETVANKNGEKNRTPNTIASPNKVRYGGPRKYQTAPPIEEEGTPYSVYYDSANDQEYGAPFKDNMTHDRRFSSIGWAEESNRDRIGVITAENAENPNLRYITDDETTGAPYKDAVGPSAEQSAAPIVSTDMPDNTGTRFINPDAASAPPYKDAVGPRAEETAGEPSIENNPYYKKIMDNFKKEMSSANTPAAKERAKKKAEKEIKEKNKEVVKEKEKAKKTEYNLKNNEVSSSVLAGLAQLLPVGAVLAAPYRKATGIDTSGAEFRGESVSPGAVVKGATLGRQSSGAEKAAAMANASAMNKYIEGTNAGPGAIVGKLAVNAKLNEQLMKIQEQDDRANLALASKEAELGQRASEFNAQQAMEASAATAENRQRASENLQKAKMYNKNLELAEKQYKREEILGALDTAASRIAGIAKDNLSYRIAERYAEAIDETGSYDRFKMMELMEKDPEFASLSTEQKNKMIAQMEAQYRLGLMEKAKAANTQMTGGTRRYTSRLGDLNRGKNKRNFNI